MPLSRTINEFVSNGVIGEPTMLTANLGYPIGYKRAYVAACSGWRTLLDLGVYTLNFASMVFWHGD